MRIVKDAKMALRRVRGTLDPREVAGGFAGLTLGEVIGGAVGGALGTLFAGPVGTAIGAEVGAFTGAMLGMTVGADAVHDLVAGSKALKEAEHAHPPAGTPPPQATSALPRDPVVEKTGNGADRRGAIRLGQAVGLASGASVGRLVAGPVGGVVGAVIGEVVGGRVGIGKGKTPDGATPVETGIRRASSRPGPAAKATQRLNGYGRRVVGESTTILVAGAVGSAFGPVGRSVGRRVGFVVGRQIKWEALTDPLPEPQPASKRPVALAADFSPVVREGSGSR